MAIENKEEYVSIIRQREFIIISWIFYIGAFEFVNAILETRP